MIKAKTYPDFKEFVKVFIANVKAGKRYDFRTYQEAILPLTYSSYWPEADIAEVEEFDYKPDYKVPFSDELLYSIGAQMRTSDFFMDLQYAIINGKDVDTIYCEWLAMVKPFSMLNAKLKDAIKPPAITQQPTNQTVNEGGTLTLSVVATNATGYQWKRMVRISLVPPLQPTQNSLYYLLMQVHTLVLYLERLEQVLPQMRQQLLLMHCL